MATATLSILVRNVRAEAGHSLSVSQGLNAIDTLKYLIARKEYELWTAFDWPDLVARWDLKIMPGQVEYQYPAGMQFDQIRHAYWTIENGHNWADVDYEIPEDAILPYGESSKTQTGGAILAWETYYNTDAEDERIRIWPTPTVEGTLRLKGLRPLNCLVSDDDCCTLDATLIAMFTAAELLARAKADDAPMREKNAQRHLQKLLKNKVSTKQKVSTFGAVRGANHFHHNRARRFVI